MMNSCEFDQPLDLRLKALNLSLGSYQQHHTLGGISTTVSGSNSSTCSTSSNSSSCSSSSSSYSTSSSYSGSSSHNVSNPIIYRPMNTPNNTTPEQLSSMATPAPWAANQRLQSPLIAHNQEPQAISGQHPTRMRPSNIHCQPLHHHQPHPLSRLHPPPSHLPSTQINLQYLQPFQHHYQQQQQPPPSQLQLRIQQQQQQQPQQPPQQQHLQPPPQQQSQQQQQVVGSSQSAPPQPPPSHHQHIQHLPPRQQMSPQFHHQPIYHPLPVRSLSVSGHLLSHSSLPARGQPQTASSMSHSPLSHSPSGCNEQLNLTTSPSQHLFKVNTVIDETNKIQMASDLSASSPNFQSSSSNPPVVTISSSSSLPSANLQSCTSSNSVSPIQRQHSLVSRYNCKPCGIVFSQPETLRAHQEGYCTKRDRAQTQVR